MKPFFASVSFRRVFISAKGAFRAAFLIKTMQNIGFIEDSRDIIAARRRLLPRLRFIAVFSSFLLITKANLLRPASGPFGRALFSKGFWGEGSILSEKRGVCRPVPWRLMRAISSLERRDRLANIGLNRCKALAAFLPSFSDNTLAVGSFAP